MVGLLSFLGRCMVMSSPVLVAYAIKKFDPKGASVGTATQVPQAEGCCSSCKAKSQ